jgi:hypothetical protein
MPGVRSKTFGKAGKAYADIQCTAKSVNDRNDDNCLMAGSSDKNSAKRVVQQVSLFCRFGRSCLLISAWRPVM